MATANGEFEVGNMREETLAELPDGGKLTHAGGDQAFTGGLEGNGVVDWLMFYRADMSARFVGMNRFEGTLDGRKGTLVIEAIGDFTGQGSTGQWRMVEGSGTGELQGLRGQGTFRASKGGAEFTLDYELDGAA
jgi:Protein of unknown function (DUF3224)